MDGKAMIIELLEQAISTYDQREEWCSKLDALKEKAAIDYRKHCLVRIYLALCYRKASSKGKR